MIMNAAVIVAAGKGTRMNKGINKVYLNIKGKAILARTLDVFFACDSIGEVVLVIAEEDMELCEKKVLKEIEIKKPFKIVFGGNERQDSVYNGITSTDKNSDIIVIHDGARPFVTKDMIEKSIEEAKKYKAVVVAMPVKDTIKMIDEEGLITKTPDRKQLWLAQTPQVFEREIIVQAYEFCKANGIKATDDSMMVEQMGVRVKVIEGSYENIKITTPEDLAFAEYILESGRI